MCHWVDSPGWRALRAIFDLAKDIAMVIIAIATLLLGPGVWSKIELSSKNALEAKELSKGNIDTISFNEKKVTDLISSSAPVTESQQIELTGFDALNIKLADFKEQNAQVKSWLSNPYSGYPALAKRIMFIMGINKLKGNGVPLTIINATNLRLHGKDTSNPIIDAQQINDEKLKKALYESWREKNSGASGKITRFEDIIEPQK